MTTWITDRKPSLGKLVLVSAEGSAHIGRCRTPPSAPRQIRWYIRGMSEKRSHSLRVDGWQELPAALGAQDLSDELGIGALNLSSRARNALLKAGIQSVDQLREMSLGQMLGLPAVGWGTATEIIDALTPAAAAELA